MRTSGRIPFRAFIRPAKWPIRINQDYHTIRRGDNRATVGTSAAFVPTRSSADSENFMIVPSMKICRWASMALGLTWLGLPPDVAGAAHDGRPSPPAVNDCAPVGQRIASEIGCFVIAREALGQLPQGPLFWHLDAYPTRSAAEAVKGLRGSVVEAEGRD